MGEKDYDPMMHTAEHLVNGAISRLLGCDRAFTTHIEKKKSKCDFHFHRNLTEEELVKVEEIVNMQIASGAEVHEEEITPQEATDRYNVSRLPEGVTSVRIVHIGDFDSCPCIGPHAGSTKELYPVKLISSDCMDGILRVRFKFNKG